MLFKKPPPQNRKNRKGEYTYQEFLNFGVFSSFELSAKENLDATAQPLQY